MARTNIPRPFQLLTVAFIMNSCCLGQNFIVAHRTSEHRTVSLNSKGKHLASELFKHIYLNSLGQSIKLRQKLLESAQAALYDNTVNEKPSKRFHQYLSITRDFFPSRRSYIKSIRTKNTKDSNLVPVIDHFAGIKTWTVPYSIRDVLSTTTETNLNERKEITTEGFNNNLEPTPLTETDRLILTKSEKEALFDHEYAVNSDVARFAPDIESNKAKFEDERYAKGIWNDYPESVPGRSHMNSQPAYDTTSRDNSPGRRRDYSSFGTFKALGPSDLFGGDLDLFSFPGSDSFGKFVPDKSKSGDPFSMFTSEEADWGRAKNRDLNQENETDVTKAVKSKEVDETFMPSGAFQSIGAFSNDKVNNFIIQLREYPRNVTHDIYFYIPRIF